MKVGEFNKKHYTKLFTSKSSQYSHGHSVKMKKVLNLFETHENGKILDIGCGDGELTLLIKEKTKAEIYGVDISEDALKIARKKGIKIKIADIDGNKIPYEDEFFDAIFCGDIIEHLVNTDDFVKELNRILKTNGYVVLTTPNLASWHNRLLLLFGYTPAFLDSTVYTKVEPFELCGHVRLFTKRTIKNLFESFGFEVEKMEGVHLLFVSDKNAVERYGKLTLNLLDKINSFFGRFPSLATVIIIKARKKKKLLKNK